MKQKSTSVLMILDGFYVGGTETHVLTIANELVKSGKKVVIAGKTGPLYKSFQDIGCRVYAIDFRVDNTVLDEARKEADIVLKKIVQTERINIIHGHQTTSTRRVLSVVRELKIPLVFTVHGTYEDIQVLQDIKEMGAAIISVSVPIKDWLKRYAIPSILIPNGIDVKEYRPLKKPGLRKQLGIPAHVPIALYASRLAWEKADICEQFIRACETLRKRHFPSLHVLIVGSGQHADNIKNLVADIQKNKKRKFIHFLGERRDMASLYSISTCVVGTGRVALEAMACARPVVAVGRHGFFGVLYPKLLHKGWNYYFGDHNSLQPCSSAMLAGHLYAVLSAPASRRTIFGKRGRQFIINNFTITRSARQLATVYRRCLRKQ
ncbi:glycosyltransferase [Effusibacillus dendaii]|nr:glycosyltransferase [Effusibacillus dendaii]